MRVVDLRSDTVTKPTPSMRKAMAEAEVGDDVFGEDPTVNRLEEMAAQRMGKDAALFVTSGTMGNLASLLVHCGRGDEVILGSQSHTFMYEQGGSASLGGIHPRSLPNQPDGTIDPDEISRAVRAENVHFPRTRLIVLENTHNRCSGSPLDPSYMKTVGDIARKHNIKIHVDGARIFNAATTLGTAASDLVREADSVTFCLSKGLGAPVGSVLCGSREFIAEARRARKVLGGGMRQAGILAAAGIVALDEMVDRLWEDHENARALAEGVSRMEGLSLDLERVKTNIVYFDIAGDWIGETELAARLREKGLLVLPTGPFRIRMVTNHHIRRGDVQYALEVISEVLKQGATS